jgi:hypothetical protein
MSKLTRDTSLLPLIAAEDLSDKRGYPVQITPDGKVQLVDGYHYTTNPPFGVVVVGAREGETATIAPFGTPGIIPVKLRPEIAPNFIKRGAVLALDHDNGYVFAPINDLLGGEGIPAARLVEDAVQDTLADAILLPMPHAYGSDD